MTTEEKMIIWALFLSGISLGLSIAQLFIR